MDEKSERIEQLDTENRRLTLILANIFEALPQPGEGRAITWQKVGYIRAMVHKAFLGDAWLDIPDEECNVEIREILPSIRKDNAFWLTPVLEVDKA